MACPDIVRPPVNVYWRSFCLLAACGLIARVIAAFYSQGIWASDEHQQYMEQAYRQLHGYGMLFWEQSVGLRHPSFQHLLAGLLACLEHVGIETPLLQASLIRLSLALCTYAGLVLLAYSLYRRGRIVASLFLMFLFAFMFDMVYISARTLTDNAVILPMCLALVLWEKRPGWAGLCLGLMFGLRLQSLAFAAGFWQVTVRRDWQQRRARPHVYLAFRPSIALSAGLALGVTLMSIWDHVEYGGCFHSTVANVRANLLDGASSVFGIKPPGYYIWQLGSTLLTASVFAIPFLLAGIRKAPALAWIAGFGILAHELIGHKEGRFLWGLYPILCVLLALGFEAAWTARARRKRFLCWVVGSFLVGSCLRFAILPRNNRPFVPTATLLQRLSQCTEVKAVAVLGCASWESGNYFYLRRQIPLHYPGARIQDLLDLPDYRGGGIDAVIVPRAIVEAGPAIPYREIDEYDGWGLFVKR